MNRVLYYLSIASFALAVPRASRDLNQETRPRKNIICYFTSWSVYRPGRGSFDVKDIDPSLCTHINFAFIGLKTTGEIHLIDEWESNTPGGYNGFRNIVALKQRNPDLKILVSMGGWNEQSNVYSVVAASPILRTRLANNVLNFLHQWGFDGFDLDWEYPGQRGGDSWMDKKNFPLLLNDLAQVLKPEGYLLTVAVSGAIKSIDISYDVVAISKVVDYISVMAYEYHSYDEMIVVHSSPLYPSKSDPPNDTGNVKSSIEYWLSQGAFPEKLILGLITYGRTFTLADRTNGSLYARTLGQGIPGPYSQEYGVLGYNEICEYHGSSKYFWDDEQKVPHRTWGNQWVGFEDKESIKYKAQFALEMNLGGMMVWDLDYDDFSGTCGEKYPLLKTVNYVFNT